MADDTNARRIARDAANARAGKATDTNKKVLGNASAASAGFGGAGRQADSDDLPEPDYSTMGMVERGAARKKWLMAKEERDKKKAEREMIKKM